VRWFKNEMMWDEVTWARHGTGRAGNKTTHSATSLLCVGDAAKESTSREGKRPISTSPLPHTFQHCTRFRLGGLVSSSLPFPSSPFRFFPSPPLDTLDDPSSSIYVGSVGRGRPRPASWRSSCPRWRRSSARRGRGTARTSRPCSSSSWTKGWLVGWLVVRRSGHSTAFDCT